MKRIALSTAAVLATLWLAPMAQAEQVAEELAALPTGDGLTLRDRIMVDDDVVRLSDLFVDQLSDGDIAIAQSPKPGQTVTLDARFLQQVARAYRLDWKPATKYQKVVIGRMSQRVTSEMVHEAIAIAVQDRIGSASDLDIALDGGDIQFDLPTDIENSVTVSGINFDPTSNRFAAVLVAPADGPPLIQRNVFGTVYAMAQVPVPTRLISAGEIIGADDLVWQPVHLARLNGNSLTDAQQLIGHMAKRPLKAGQILRQTDVAVSPIIRKNDLIRLVVRSGQMALSVQGKAMQDGATGQSIRVINVNSNRQLSGTVVDAGTVSIDNAVAAIN